MFDSLGNAQDVDLIWTRLGSNQWSLQVNVPGSTPSSFGPAVVDFGGAVGGSTVTPGTLSGLTSAGGLTASAAGAVDDDASFSFNLDFGSGAQAITLDLGSYGNTPGTTQYAGDTLTLKDFKQDA